MKKLALLIVVIPCLSQASNESPYVGEEFRAIKSLSTKEITSLRRGDGMGFAKLAELNHFPGPKHVLNVSSELDLSPEQFDATNALFEEMRSNAIVLGEELVRAESQLDQNFADGSINSQTLQRALLDIGRIRAELRFVHLRSHLRQKQLLTPAQISKYDQLRGYAGAAHDHNSRANPHDRPTQ